MEPALENTLTMVSKYFSAPNISTITKYWPHIQSFQLSTLFAYQTKITRIINRAIYQITKIIFGKIKSRSYPRIRILGP